MRCPGWNDDDIAFCNPAPYAAFDRRAAESGSINLCHHFRCACASLRIDQRAARHQQTGTVEHVVHLADLVVRRATGQVRSFGAMHEAHANVVCASIDGAHRRVDRFRCDRLFEGRLNVGGSDVGRRHRFHAGGLRKYE